MDNIIQIDHATHDQQAMTYRNQYVKALDAFASREQRDEERHRLSLIAEQAYDAYKAYVIGNQQFITPAMFQKFAQDIE